MTKGGLGSRLIVAAWGIPLLLGLTYIGGWATTILIAAISLGALEEYYRLQMKSGIKPLRWTGLSAGFFIILCWSTGDISVVWPVIAATLIVLVAGLMYKSSSADISSTLTGLSYQPVLAGSFLFVREWHHPVDVLPDEGRWLAFAIWGAIWIGDTAAYFGGKAIGKHKLAPDISPNKTVEGFIFGFLGSVLSGLVWWWVGLIHFDIALVIGLSAGLVGQIGDLVESKMKREAGVKDSGSFLPGHGGLLDRFDSMVATTPVVAMYLWIKNFVVI